LRRNWRNSVESLAKIPYDGGRLITVQQNAQPGSSGTQTRSIAYDDLGRKTSETIPEWSAGTGSAGTATYTYDSDSSGKCSGTYAGDLIKSVDNAGNVTCFTYDLLHRPLSSKVVSGTYSSVTPQTYFVYDAATYSGTAMQNAMGTVAEAYTCTPGTCASKLTDIFNSTSPVTSGATAGGVLAQMWEMTPHSGGYFLTQDTYYPNGAIGAISASLVGGSDVSTTNLIPDSMQVGGSSWGLYCAGNSNGMVLDTPAVSAPDGSNTATQFTMPSSFSCGSAGPWGALTNIQGGLTVGDTYTVSAWLRGAVGGEGVYLDLNDCGWSLFTLTTSWQRYTSTFSSISSAIANCGTGARGFQVFGTGPNSTYYVWGPQTVQASTEEPYVATTDGPATYIGIPSMTFGVDGEGRPYSATDGTNNLNLVTATAYNPASSATSITYGNASTGSGNDVDSFSYDPNTYRPTNLTYTIKPSSGSYNVASALTWNANGSLQQFQYTDGSPSPLSQTCTYSADDLSRIASVNCGNSTWAQNFSYDAFGNINKTVPSGATGTSYQAAYSTVTNQVSGGPSYDANGNQLTSTPASLTWNALNQPITVNSTTATYDALGRMVEKGSGSTYTQFVFRPSGAILAVYSGGLTKGTIPLPGGSTAIYNGSGLNYLRHTDWLGSSRLATTWAHAVYSKEAYAHFGETYNEAGTPDRSFTGQDQDVATGPGGAGVYDFLFRKYDPSAGRWLSPDPSGLSAAKREYPQSLNRYAYVQNNPMALTDPNGLACVYADSYGNVTSIDNFNASSGASGVCEAAGGIYVDGYTDKDMMGFDSTSGQYNIMSVYGPDSAPMMEDTEATGQGGAVYSFAPDGTVVQICSGSCILGQSSISMQQVTDELSPTGGGIQMSAFWNWLMSQTSIPTPGSMGAMNPVFQLTTGTNYCGPGGFGAPTNGSDWACAIHDFQYSITGNTFPNNQSASYPGGPQLQRINQQLCNNTTGAVRFYVQSVFGSGVDTWGCQ
jgi:RHS repeat-associated protein